MVWNVNIDEVVRNEGVLIVRLTLSDGVKKVRPDEYRVTSELQLKQKINVDIAKLSQVDVELPKLPTGPYDPTIAITPPPPPSSEEIAKNKFAADLRAYRSMLKTIEIGVKTAGDKDVMDLQALLKSGYINDYLGLF